MKALDVKLTSIDDGDSIAERYVKLTAASPLTIGRASRNRDIEASAVNTAINNPVVSKQHAVIRTDPDCKFVYIRDMQSMHGTKVGDTVLSKGEEVAFGSGALLQFGTTVIHGQPEGTFIPATYKVDFKPAGFAMSLDQTSLPDSDLKQGYTDYTNSDYSTDSDSDEELYASMDTTSPTVPAIELSAACESHANDAAWGDYADRWSNSEDDDQSEQNSCFEGDMDDYPDEESVSADSDMDEDEDNHAGDPTTPREASVEIAEIAPTPAQTAPVIDLADKDQDNEPAEVPEPIYHTRFSWDDVTAGSSQGHEGPEASKSIYDSYNWDGDSVASNNQWVGNLTGEAPAKYVSPYYATDTASVTATGQVPESFKVSFDLKGASTQLKPTFEKPSDGTTENYGRLEDLEMPFAYQKPFMNAISDIVEGTPATKRGTTPTNGSKRKIEEVEFEDSTLNQQSLWDIPDNHGRTAEEDESMLETKMKEHLAYAMEHGHTFDQCLKGLRDLAMSQKIGNMKFGFQHEMKKAKIQSKWIAKARESYFTSKDLDSADISGEPTVSKSVTEASSAQTAVEQSVTPPFKPSQTLAVQRDEDAVEVVETSAMITEQPPKKRTPANFLSRACDGAVGFVIGGAVMFGALANLPESLFA